MEAAIQPKGVPVVQHIDKAVPAAVGRENLHAALPPHVDYEGGHRFDPYASWTAEEEKRVVRKTDIRLLSWLCVMVRLAGRWPQFSFSLTFTVLWIAIRPRQPQQRSRRQSLGGPEAFYR